MRLRFDTRKLPQELVARIREELDATRADFERQFPALDWDIAIYSAFVSAAAQASRLAGWRTVAILSCIGNALMLGIMFTKGVL